LFTCLVVYVHVYVLRYLATDVPITYLSMIVPNIIVVYIYIATRVPQCFYIKH